MNSFDIKLPKTIDIRNWLSFRNVRIYAQKQINLLNKEILCKKSGTDTNLVLHIVSFHFSFKKKSILLLKVFFHLHSYFSDLYLI